MTGSRRSDDDATLPNSDPHAAAELRQIKEHLELVLESAGLGMWDHDLVTDEVRRDERWARMLGYDPEEIAGTASAWRELLHPEDRERVVTIALEHDEGLTPQFVAEHRMRAKSGEWRWILNWGRVVEWDERGRPLRAVGTHLDITESKRAAEKQHDLEAHLQQAQKVESLSTMAGGVAHDFNNLFQAILGNVELVQRAVPPNSKVMDHVREIESATKHASELTSQLLAYSGHRVAKIEQLDLSNLVLGIRDILTAAISKKVSLRFDVATHLPPIQGDRSQLQQMVMSLATNASEAMEDRAGIIRISTREFEHAVDAAAVDCNGHALRAGRYVVFEIVDSGCGIDPDHRSRIFDPFFTTKFTGRGLGLAAAWGIAKAHGACIQVKSTLEVGSTFRVFLPTTETAESNGIDTGEQTAASRWETSGTALLVDDEAPIRRVMTQMLEHLGFKVLTARNGREAIEIFEPHAERIDLVLLDLSMPELGGHEVFDALQRLAPQIKVILCSGYEERDAVRGFEGKGLAGFLHKPYDLEELERVIKGIRGPRTGNQASGEA